MQIGIFETDHFEGAYPVIKLFDNGHNKITVFAYENSFRQFKHLFKDSLTRYHWVIKKPTESKYQFIYRIYKTSKEKRIDILYLNTISDNHLIYATMVAGLYNTRIIATLHDINGYFTFHPSWNVKTWIRYIGKRCLIKAAKEFNVVSSTMVDYLKEKLPAHKQVHCIPGSIFEERDRPDARHETMNHIRIVIPGTIDSRRRNYDFVFDLLDEINKASINVVVVLLGGIHALYGRSILEKCKVYNSKYHNLIFFDLGIVDQPVFDYEMDQAHVVLIPSVINTIIADGIQETYGLSISSGNIFDVIKHAKPFLVPTALDIPQDLKTSCFKYSTSQEVIDFLKNFLAKPEIYTDWKQKANQNSQAYTIERIRDNNASLFAGHQQIY